MFLKISIPSLILLSLLTFSCSKKDTSIPSLTIEPTPAVTISSSSTPLHEAAKNGDQKLCEILISKGADIHKVNQWGDTPLTTAVSADHVELSRYLLTNGAKISYTYKHEDTPEKRKQFAQKSDAIFSNIELQKHLKEQFADLPEDLRKEMLEAANGSEMKKSMVDLHFEESTENAIEHATSLDMLKMLVLEFNADINYVASDGTYPLATFSETEPHHDQGELEAIRWMLSNGANPNNTSTGETAIFKAITYDNFDITKLLLDQRANINAIDVDGWSPLFAVKSLEMAKLLIAKGADPTITDQANFACWGFIKDKEITSYLKAQAKKRGLKTWTTYPKR